MTTDDQPRSRRDRWWRGLIAALLMGIVTTIAVAIGSAYFVPLGQTASAVPLIERDGDHLGLWIIDVSRVSASRAIWFEKGRNYNKSGVGPAGGSSAAVACWSLAVSLTIRTSPTAQKPVDLPPDVRERISQTPTQVWGVAVDRRGWPWLAFEGQIVGTMNASSPDPYVAEVGFILPYEKPIVPAMGSSSVLWRPSSLADVRIIPTRPLWRGILLDATFWTLMWWILLHVGAVAWAAILARSRSRLGHCKHCGYDLQGLEGPICPECGKARSPSLPQSPAPTQPS